ncbi:FtsQ-type POTRA domain-containing protein [Clostridium sp.]|uniref:cell division protein FtsQ/DivIB n=1 Tax=Clostridium sp. TaxID=1506 RepID=UPI00261D42C6|nr:FtsQ-type POTRA domain-containing protein [Clostridium sp.]
MNKDISKFIRKRKRSKIIKKVTLWLFIIIIGIIIFVYKAPLFNLKKINISGLVSLTDESIQEVLKYEIGQNVFTIDYKEMEKNLTTNPYIKKVKISKKGINQLNIGIQESKIGFYIEKEGKFYTINNEGVIVEELTDIIDKKLISIYDIDIKDNNIGDKISEDNNIYSVLDEFYKMKEVLPEDYTISRVGIKDLNNINCYIKEIKIIIGNELDMKDKMNLALNAIDQGTIKKGYIDMSFNGKPILKEEE